jgi:transcriptional regulator with XRE-family HTH domain
MIGNELRAVLSQNIKNYRTYRSLSQADLAEKAGISITFLSNIERGNKWPYPETLTNIAQALEIEVYELFKPDSTTIDDTAKVKINSLVNDISASVQESIKRTYLQYLKN